MGPLRHFRESGKVAKSLRKCRKSLCFKILGRGVLCQRGGEFGKVANNKCWARVKLLGAGLPTPPLLLTEGLQWVLETFGRAECGVRDQRTTP